MSVAANDNEPMAAFLLGIKAQVAALAGMPMSANPYRLDTKEGLRWMAAWAGATAALWEDQEETYSGRETA
jgi:hypothetical protein